MGKKTPGRGHYRMAIAQLCATAAVDGVRAWGGQEPFVLSAEDLHAVVRMSVETALAKGDEMLAVEAERAKNTADLASYVQSERPTVRISRTLWARLVKQHPNAVDGGTAGFANHPDGTVAFEVAPDVWARLQRLTGQQNPSREDVEAVLLASLSGQEL